MSTPAEDSGETGFAYRTPRALEQAVKSVAEASPMDTGRAVQSFWFHRLLCRVFCDSRSGFVLKGGRAMLARTMDARATRDVDLLAEGTSIDEAVERLKVAASLDLGDHVHFVFEKVRPIKARDEYRTGANVTFVPWLGSKRLQPISIDLVVDDVPLERAERMVPADRLEIRGVETFEYLVYPAEAALSDKVCAILERHDGRPSSRVKDLVDIVVYATSVDINGLDFQNRLRRESGARGLELPDQFDVPREWRGTYETSYSKLVAQTGLSERYSKMESAVVFPHWW